jgi:hypothetical protein
VSAISNVGYGEVEITDEKQMIPLITRCHLSDTAAGVWTWPAEALIDPVCYLCSLGFPSQAVFTAGGGSGRPKEKVCCGWGDMF